MGLYMYCLYMVCYFFYNFTEPYFQLIKMLVKLIDTEKSNLYSHLKYKALNFKHFTIFIYVKVNQWLKSIENHFLFSCH